MPTRPWATPCTAPPPALAGACAASAGAAASGEAGRASPSRTSLKYSTGTSLPSTRSRKSSGLRPETRPPWRSVTTASTLTTRTSIDSPNEGGAS